MNMHNSLDHDGLDGVLPAKKTTSVTYKYFIWIVPFVILIIILFAVFESKKEKTVVDVALKAKADVQLMTSDKIESIEPKVAVIVKPIEPSSLAELIPDQEKPIDNNVFVKPTKTGLLDSSDKQSGLDSEEMLVVDSIETLDSVVVENSNYTFRFNFSVSTIDSLSTVETQGLIHFVNSCKASVTIVGHTCNMGTAELNHYLALEREKAMQQYLIKQNISSDLLSIRSEGMNQPAYQGVSQ